MRHNSLTWVKQPLHSISADALRNSSSIATATTTEIWPYRKKVKGYPRIILWINLVDLASQMQYTKIQPQSFLGSEEDFLGGFFTIYEHGGHLVRQCRTIWINWQNPFDRKPHLKFGENWSRGFRKEAIQRLYVFIHVYSQGKGR